MTKKDEIVQSDSDANIELLLGRAPMADEDPETIRRQIIARLLAAETIEDVFREDSSTATRDLVGVPLEIRDAVVRKSALEGEEGVYLLLDATRLDDGTNVLVNTGSPKIMAQVWRCKMKGWLPIQVEVIEVGVPKPGQNAPLGLKAIGATAQRAAA